MSEDNAVGKMLQVVAEQSIDKSSQVLSKTLKSGAKIELKQVSLVDISKATEMVTSTNKEVVATFIDLLGDAPFKFLFYVEIKDAFMITDLFIGQEPGTTKAYDEYTESAVQEIGNILSSAISNVFSASFQINMKPSPPTVIRDFSGCLFQEFISIEAAETNQILLIESLFQVISKQLDCHMYLLPIEGSDKVLEFSAG